MSVDALLPVLVAELADEDARKMIAELAAAGRVCLVPLVDPPVDASMHVLEVSTPGQKEPLVVLAEPAGAPTERGFPLRLHPYGSAPTKSIAPPPKPEGLPSVKSSIRRPQTITALHTQDLLGDAVAHGSQPDAAEALVGREIAGGKLVIEELVGVGGMGAVFRARHKHLGKDIALKVLHARFREDLAFGARFHAEALAVSQLDHPNLVRIIDYGQEPDGMLYLAMDFLSGVELSDVLAAQGTLPMPRIVDIAVQATAGLGHAHARGIVHRDVKPSNILLVKSDDDEGRTVDVVKVCDFGIAAQAGSRELVGTPAYMSPEQCQGLEVDARSDVYSLGVIMYELATGQVPFNSDDTTKIINMHLNQRPAVPSLVRPVDARLEKLILRMLAKEPSERPQNMRELRAELKGLLKPPSLVLAKDEPPSSIRRGPTSTGDLPAVNPAVMVAKLVQEPVSTLRETLVSIERFTQEARVIAVAMRMMLERKEIAALANVVAILRKVATDPNGDARSELAGRVVRTLMDPTLLAPVAQHALTERDDTAAEALLSTLGPAAAHALYAVRLRAHPTPPLRARFVGLLRSIGAPAWPIMSAALQRNVPGEAVNHDPRLAEDLLRAMPAIADETVGGLVAKYLRWGEPAVRRAAVAPLVALWGQRARALLLAVLVKDADEGARIAALGGLREVGGVDEHVVRKIDDVFSDGSISQTVAAGDALKQAVAEALADATPEARPIAAATLKRALATKPLLTSQVLLAVARSYVAIDGEGAVNAVASLAKSVDDPLKTQLTGIIGTRSAG